MIVKVPNKEVDAAEHRDVEARGGVALLFEDARPFEHFSLVNMAQASSSIYSALIQTSSNQARIHKFRLSYFDLLPGSDTCDF